MHVASRRSPTAYPEEHADRQSINDVENESTIFGKVRAIFAKTDPEPLKDVLEHYPINDANEQARQHSGYHSELYAIAQGRPCALIWFQ
ncbi:MAG: hypothetical protein H0V70_14780 [Ktedonobacteraceae bacterium]|nr:hypothetical protein [Ktedonobacteraceae bacterium]